MEQSAQPSKKLPTFQLRLFTLFSLLIAATIAFFVILAIVSEYHDHRSVAEENLRLQGLALADAIRLPLFAEHRDLVVQIADEFLRRPEILGLEVITADGRVLVRRPDPLPTTGRETISATVEVRSDLPLPAAGTEIGVEPAPAAGKPIGSIRLYRGTGDIMQSSGAAAVRIVLLGITAWLVISVCCYPLLRGLTSSYREIIAGLSRLQGGDYATPVPLLGADESGQAAAAINDLAESLRQRDSMAAELRRSEERYRAIVESQLEFVSRHLPGGILTFVNDALADWLGYAKEELLGKSFYPFIQDDNRNRLIEGIESLTCENPVLTNEQLITGADGVARWCQWVNRAICDDEGNIVEYQGVGRDITARREAELYLVSAKEILEREVAARTDELTATNRLLLEEIEERKQIEQELTDYQQQLEEMGAEIALAAERERGRIAGELHDEVGQRLLLLRMKLEMLASRLPEKMHDDAVAELLKLNDQTIQDIRTLTFQLRPPVLATAGLAVAVEWLGRELHESHGLSVALTKDKAPLPLNYETAATLFQMIRECLLNVAKHAGTNRAEVDMRTVAGSLTVTVSDNGSGFTPAPKARNINSGGFGLFNVKQRIKYLGGSVTVDSAPGRGTRAVITLPLAQEAGGG